MRKAFTPFLFLFFFSTPLVKCIASSRLHFVIPHSPTMTRSSILFILQGLSLNNSKMAEGEGEVVADLLSFVPEVREDVSRVSLEEDYLSVLRELRILLLGGGYDRAQALRFPNHPLPATRSELEEDWNFRKWPGYIVPRSQVKGFERRVYRRHTVSPKVSIAETISLDQSVRETEVIQERLDDTGWDFYAYSQDGTRTLKSTFISNAGKEVRSAVPYSCMTCHYDSQRHQFQYLPKSFHP